MKAIYKYPLAITDIQTIYMPAGAMILSAHNKNDTLCIWALVDTDRPKEQVKIRILATGEEISKDENLEQFISTVLFNDGRFVFHVFKEK